MPKRVDAKGHEVPLSASARRARNQAQNLASRGSLAHAEDEVRELEKCSDKITGVIKGMDT